MSSRDAILHRIRTSLSAGPAVPPPPVPEVWPRENPDRQTMAARFSEELTKIFGEVVRCDSMAAAQKRLAELVETAGWASLGALDCPLTREAVAGLVPERVRWVDDAWTRHDIAQLPAGLIAADALVADSGTCAIACQSAHARLMCYLPPACVVVARGEQLAEHLPAAWAEIVRRAADPQARGEIVLVTGPSRTADIEKILILGVHGPKRLVVLLVD